MPSSPPAPLPAGGDAAPSAPVAPLAPGGSASPSAPPAPLGPGGAVSPSAPPQPLAAGGSGSSVDRIVITGTLTIDGEPVETPLTLYYAGEYAVTGSARPHYTQSGEPIEGFNVPDGIVAVYSGVGSVGWVLVESSNNVEAGGWTTGITSDAVEDATGWTASNATGTPSIELIRGGPAAPPAPFPPGGSSSPSAPPAPLGAGKGISPTAPPAPLAAGAGVTPSAPLAPLAPGRVETPPSPPQPV